MQLLITTTTTDTHSLFMNFFLFEVERNFATTVNLPTLFGVHFLARVSILMFPV